MLNCYICLEFGIEMNIDFRYQSVEGHYNRFLQMSNSFDFPLNRPQIEIWMLTIHVSENSEGRNNRGRKFLYWLRKHLSQHLQIVNTNLDFKILLILFTTARTWKQPRYPSADKWLRRLWYKCTMEYYSAIKKNAFESVLMRWMKPEPIIENEVRKKNTNTVY